MCPQETLAALKWDAIFDQFRHLSETRSEAVIAPLLPFMFDIFLASFVTKKKFYFPKKRRGCLQLVGLK
jgi:hypothetical protein